MWRPRRGGSHVAKLASLDQIWFRGFGAGGREWRCFASQASCTAALDTGRLWLNGQRTSHRRAVCVKHSHPRRRVAFITLRRGQNGVAVAVRGVPRPKRHCGCS
jgi:hypothetical protein